MIYWRVSKTPQVFVGVRYGTTWWFPTFTLRKCLRVPPFNSLLGFPVPYKFSVPELPLYTQALVSISPTDLVLFFHTSLPEWGFSSEQQIASQPTGPLSLSLDSPQYIWIWVFPRVSLEKCLSIFILHMTASVCLIWLPSLINHFVNSVYFFLLSLILLQLFLRCHWLPDTPKTRQESVSSISHTGC